MSWAHTFGSLSGSIPLSYLDDNFAEALQLSGGTMTGALVLSGNPSNDLDAAPKQYVDATGRILQSAATQTSTYVSTTVLLPAGTAVPNNTQGTQLITATITPKSPTSSLHVQAKIPIFQLVGASVGCAALFRDATAAAIAATFSVSNGTLLMDAYVSAGSTTATTFALRYGPSTTGTMYVNGNSTLALFSGVMFVTLQVDEIAT